MQPWSNFLLWGQSRIEKGASLLAPLGWIWGAIVRLRNLAYDRGWLRAERIPCPVVSVGNIVAGGTGKTPFVLLLAEQFAGVRLAILSRGYGAFPDEPMLLQRRLPHAKVYVGKDRVTLAHRAVQEGAELIILDDGLQYRRLHRDIDVALLFGEDPFGKGRFLPHGFLRDDPRRLRAADALFVNGALTAPLDLPHTTLALRVGRVVDAQTGGAVDIRGKKVAIFSGIARHGAFRKTVESLGAHVLLEWRLPDHAKPSETALKAFIARAQGVGANRIVCTEKDAVKWSSAPVCYVEISLEVKDGQDLWENLIAKIRQTIDTRAL